MQYTFYALPVYWYGQGIAQVAINNTKTKKMKVHHNAPMMNFCPIAIINTICQRKDESAPQ